ncbi:MAG: hypothetical protein M3325_17365 [Actinomycetota bacterium]|nr:hypothetical protein [Actinomycetota bacterium]
MSLRLGRLRRDDELAAQTWPRTEVDHDSAAGSPERAPGETRRPGKSDYVHRADRRRRDGMAYLADISQLLGQSLDVQLTATMISQIVVG